MLVASRFKNAAAITSLGFCLMMGGLALEPNREEANSEVMEERREEAAGAVVDRVEGVDGVLEDGDADVTDDVLVVDVAVAVVATGALSCCSTCVRCTRVLYPSTSVHAMTCDMGKIISTSTSSSPTAASDRSVNTRCACCGATVIRYVRARVPNRESSYTWKVRVVLGGEGVMMCCSWVC